MTDKMSRREFVVTSTAGIAAAASAPASGQAPAVVTKKSVKPAVIASANGHEYKNGGRKTCVETAFEMMMSGKDVLESLIAGREHAISPYVYGINTSGGPLPAVRKARR